MVADRNSEAVLDYCARKGVGFIPSFPLAAGELVKPGALLDREAKKHGASPSLIALAWVLKRSPVMLPFLSTSKEENVAAAGIELSDEDSAALHWAERAQSTKVA